MKFRREVINFYGDLDIILFNIAPLNIPKLLAFKLLRWAQNWTSQCEAMTFSMLIDILFKG